MQKDIKVLAIIPAYNEEATIESVINEIKEYEHIHILVVNDGSKDRTSSIIHRLNVEVIDLPKNQGIGRTMKIGYQYAKENGYDVAIQIDADGQHEIRRINELISMILNHNYDLVIGSRYLSKTSYKSSFLRYLGAKYFTALIYILHKKSIKDTTSGYRAANKRVINYFSENYPTYYPEVPMLSELLSKGYRACEISVEMKERQGGKSSITFFSSIIYFLKITFICIRKRFSYKKLQRLKILRNK